MQLNISEKMKIKRQKMPEQSPLDRLTNFDEVTLGYSEEKAVLEASRCLQCKKAPCISGCPIEIKIPEFIKLITEKKYNDAADKIKETNPLPAICGRVCPQEQQCELKCVLEKKGKPIAIGRLERFVADYQRNNNLPIKKIINSNNKIKVAVVGSGPASLVAAGSLAEKKYDVTVFEALHEPGGVLIYGIPEFRLPKNIVKYEIDYLKSLGVKFELNNIIGKTYSIEDLFQKHNYKAIFLGTGSGLPKFMNIPGENLIGVYSANEFLTRINLMRAYKFPEYTTPLPEVKKVAVIGGGNVSMDSARVARRLGAEVHLIYRRSRQEMPARNEEIQHAEEEGIKFNLLTNPIRYIGDENSRIIKVECIRMKLGKPDKTGRRSPIPIENSNFFLDIDTVIVSIGNSPNPILTSNTEKLEISKKGTLIVNEKGMTTISGIFAGGDCVIGSATVVLAAGAGRNAAIAIDDYLKNSSD